MTNNSNAQPGNRHCRLLVLVLVLLAPSLATATQYVLKITDAPWPAEANFGSDTLLADDDFYPARTAAGIALGFDFPFYCNTYDEVYIDANGFITLGSTAIAAPGDAVPTLPGWDDNFNVQFPLENNNDSSPEFYQIPMIALFWTDVVSGHATGGTENNGTIHWRLDSASSPRRLIVTWEDVFHYYKLSPQTPDPGDPNTSGNNFQLILYEDGRIQFNYGNMGWSGNNVYHRRSATIGIYSADHTGGACDNGSLPSMELFPLDDSVAGKQLLFLPDQDLDLIPGDGDGSGIAGDALCQELLDWPLQAYNDPWGTCSAGVVGLGCEYPFHEDCDTSPGAGDGVCEPCDVCVRCDDNCPTVANSNQLDTEFDGLGDACDPDDDNDGILDWLDTYPLDTDNDGLDNAIDDDDDNDGLLDDVDDPFLLDTDNNGTTNDVDSDDDGDGFPDASDPFPLDINYADGDLDASGDVNAADVLIVQRIVLNLENPGMSHLQHGDMVPPGAVDGVIDLGDALAVIKKALE